MTRDLVVTVTSARAKSYDAPSIPGFVAFIEDHDAGDCDPKAPYLTTFVWAGDGPVPEVRR